ncbi:MAG: phage holin family protein [Acidobacteria bacterium]|nr:phage holin family protein [Acidobacteriota bacterium]
MSQTDPVYPPVVPPVPRPVAAPPPAGGAEAEEAPTLRDLVMRIVGNLQEIVRSEFRLARAEIGESLAGLKRGIVLAAAGALLALLALATLVATAVLGLATVMPAWAAALLVGVALAVVAGIFTALGTRSMRRAGSPTPDKTVESVKETVTWARHRMKSSGT